MVGTRGVKRTDLVNQSDEGAGLASRASLSCPPPLSPSSPESPRPRAPAREPPPACTGPGYGSNNSLCLVFWLFT